MSIPVEIDLLYDDCNRQKSKQLKTREYQSNDEAMHAAFDQWVATKHANKKPTTVIKKKTGQLIDHSNARLLLLWLPFHPGLVMQDYCFRGCPSNLAWSRSLYHGCIMFWCTREHLFQLLRVAILGFEDETPNKHNDKSVQSGLHKKCRRVACPICK